MPRVDGKLIVNGQEVDDWFYNSKPFSQPVKYQGIEFKYPENLFQALKTEKHQVEERRYIASLPPFGKAGAKWYGRWRVKLRPGWNNVQPSGLKLKQEVMLHVIRLRFRYDSDEGQMLLNTIPPMEDWPELREINDWHDNDWGDCQCSKCWELPGQNNFGRLLMRHREDLYLQIPY